MGVSEQVLAKLRHPGLIWTATPMNEAISRVIEKVDLCEILQSPRIDKVAVLLRGNYHDRHYHYHYLLVWFGFDTQLNFES